MEQDDFWPSQCENPSHYERMIDLLMMYNPSCTSREWAENAINACISGVVFGGDLDRSTGCCMALRNREGKARLFLVPLCPVT